MSDIRVYDRVLRPDEISSLLAGQGSRQGLIAAWDFDPPEANPVRDSSGHGHDLIEVR
jgi:hypothetical protein